MGGGELGRDPQSSRRHYVVGWLVPGFCEKSDNPQLFVKLSRSRRPRQNLAVKALNPWPIESEDQVTLKAADPFAVLANRGHVLAGVRSRFNSSLRGSK